MCPQRLVHRDGDVSGTKDRDGIDPRDLLSLSPVLLDAQVLFYCFGVIPILAAIARFYHHQDSWSLLEPSLGDTRLLL